MHIGNTTGNKPGAQVHHMDHIKVILTPLYYWSMHRLENILKEERGRESINPSQNNQLIVNSSFNIQQMKELYIMACLLYWSVRNYKVTSNLLATFNAMCSISCHYRYWSQAHQVESTSS
jgi:hypothetical protein